MSDGAATAPSAGEFVGRERELAALVGLWRAAEAGAGRVAFVAGDAGIGKSRLLRELAARVTAEGTALVAWGLCREDTSAPAFWPWIQVLSGLELGPLPPAVGADLARLVAGPQQSADIEDPNGGPSAQFRMRDSVTRAIESVARTRPLLVLLDDLHRADRSSLQLLDHLGAETFRVPVMIVGAHRERNLDLSHSPSSGDGLRSSIRFSLAGLSEQEAERLASGFFGPLPADPELVEHTGGNPLFVIELATLSASRGTWARHDVPETLVGAVRQRLGALQPEHQRLIEFAAVAGREFEASRLASATGASAAAVRSAIEAGRRAGLLDLSGPPRFAHALLRDGIYRSTPPEARLRCHEALLESLASDSAVVDNDAAQLAHHAEVLVAGGADPSGIHWMLRAAETSANRLAPADALDWAKRAKALLDDFAPLDLGLAYDVQVAIGRAALGTGSLDESRSAFESASAIGSRLGDGRRAAEAALGAGRAVVSAGQVDRALVELLEGVLEVAPPDLVPALLGRLAIEWYWHGGSTRSRELSADAVARAEALHPATPGARQALAQALQARQFTLRGPSDPQERLDIGARLIQAADAAGDDEAAFSGRVFRTADLLHVADLAGFRTEIAALAIDADRSRLPLRQWYATLHQASLAILEGRVSAASSLVDHGRSLAKSIGAPAGEAYRVGQLTVLWRDLGRLPELVSDAESVGAALPYFRTTACDLALIYAEIGEMALARDLIQRLAANRAAEIPPDSLWVASLAILVEASVTAGVTEVLEELYQLLAPFGGRFSVQGVPCSWGPVDRQLGLAALAIGWFERAEHHLEAALETAIAVGARPFVLRTRLDLARSRLVWRNVDPGQEAAAAAREADRLLLPGLAHAARSLMPRPQDETDRSDLSDRERDVVSLLATGATNRAIAASLFISVNTVERHLSNIFRKLGVQNRAAAAAWAIRHSRNGGSDDGSP